MPLRNVPIKQKIIIVSMVTTAIALFLCNALFFVVKINSSRSGLIKEMSSIASLFGANSKAALSFDDREAATTTLSSLAEDSRIISATLYDENGLVFATFHRGDSPGLGELAASTGKARIRQDILLNDQTIGAIELVVDTMSGFWNQILEFGAISLLVLILSALGAYLVTRRLQRFISEPIISLSHLAKRVSEEKDYSLRARKVGNDEIGELIERFNEMLEQISVQDSSIRQSEILMRLITDSLPVLIAYVDSTERYRFINRAYEEWFHKPVQEVVGSSVREVVGEQAYEHLKDNIARTLGGEPTNYEGPVDYGESGARYISASLIPDKDTYTGQVRGYFALISDITDRKQAEDALRNLNESLEQRVQERTDQLRQSQEKLRYSERLASIGTLAAGMAHEIRNPINSISLATQHAIRYQSTLTDQLREVLETIGSEARRCGRIIKNILLFAKSERTTRSREYVNEVVVKSIQLARTYSNSGRAVIKEQLGQEIPAVMMNPTEIEQVLVNLIHNAMESSPTGIEIVISTGVRKESAYIEVRDDGPGISEENLLHIFDPFFSTKRKQGNTGLGLSLCHGIIAQHGGNLSVLSQTGKGATFTIELPLAHEAPVRNEHSEAL